MSRQVQSLSEQLRRLSSD
ncbi:hypothetical protein LD869_24940 [Salmonella enterica]|nr:hypothetical protein [Enterobacter hormaechei]MDJ5003289.1 hypothetical protein [Salmonella enterica]MDN3776514.1 hypothetical protein [Enterobacter hormaechei]